ncbi:hypothetical protein POP15_296 [Pectobacterium phage POP15]|nr:hypothetical protein POP15_296 [Pectobacterium phage POP15]
MTKKILSSLNTTGESNVKDEYDFLTGWGEGIESGCIEDERPDL